MADGGSWRRRSGGASGGAFGGRRGDGAGGGSGERSRRGSGGGRGGDRGGDRGGGQARRRRGGGGSSKLDYLFNGVPAPLRRQLRANEVALYSITEYGAAERMARLLAGLEGVGSGGTVVDGTAGVGGNTLRFAAHCDAVTAYELDAETFDFLQHNVSVLGLSGRVTCVRGSIVEQQHRVAGDLFFVDPPWGGPEYKNLDRCPLFLDGLPVGALLARLAPRFRYIALKGPLNLDRGALVDAFAAERGGRPVPPMTWYDRDFKKMLLVVIDCRGLEPLEPLEPLEAPNGAAGAEAARRSSPTNQSTEKISDAGDSSSGAPPGGPARPVAACEEMCPARELRTRAGSAVHPLEATDESRRAADPRRRVIDPRRAVAQHRRSAAGRETLDACDLRTLACLERTVAHLAALLGAEAGAPDVSAASVASFVCDRLCAVRSELTMQDAAAAAPLRTARLLLRVARIHATLGYTMLGADLPVAGGPRARSVGEALSEDYLEAFRLEQNRRDAAGAATAALVAVKGAAPPGPSAASLADSALALQFLAEAAAPEARAVASLHAQRFASAERALGACDARAAALLDAAAGPFPCSGTAAAKLRAFAALFPGREPPLLLRAARWAAAARDGDVYAFFRAWECGGEGAEAFSLRAMAMPLLRVCRLRRLGGLARHLMRGAQLDAAFVASRLRLAGDAEAAEAARAWGLGPADGSDGGLAVPKAPLAWQGAARIGVPRAARLLWARDDHAMALAGAPEPGHPLTLGLAL